MGSEDRPGFNWFKFYHNDWLTDRDVVRMSFAERGVYFHLLCVQARDGDLPCAGEPHDKCPLLISRLAGIDSRMVARWWPSWGKLFPNDAKCRHHANRKLWNLTVGLRKSWAEGPVDIEVDRDSDETESETRPVEGEEEAPPAPEAAEPETTGSETTPEAAREPSLAEKFASHFWNLCGQQKRHQSDATVKSWTRQAEAFLRTHDHDRAVEVMNWALTESPNWTQYIRTVKKQDTMEYFIEKYDTIEVQMDAAKASLEVVKKRTTKITEAAKKGAKDAELPGYRRKSGEEITRDSKILKF
ncbi:MAG TPA: hypothetical protein VMT39_02360 [Candidatus Bathyarchaeia archaeon]|nr:hypothetical protein [Candidatus Bathyarchaeia archaeon]